MANTINAETLVNGPRSVVVQYTITSDGTADYSDYPLFSFDDYIALDKPTPNAFAVRSVSGTSATGSTFQLKFGSTTENNFPFFASTINESPQSVWDGGIPNLVQDTDNTIRLSTTDFDVSGLVMQVTVEVKKKRRLETQ